MQNRGNPDLRHHIINTGPLTHGILRLGLRNGATRIGALVFQRGRINIDVLFGANDPGGVDNRFRDERHVTHAQHVTVIVINKGTVVGINIHLP